MLAAQEEGLSDEELLGQMSYVTFFYFSLSAIQSSIFLAHLL